MRIRVEVSSLATQHQSGVATYTKSLTESLGASKDIQLYGHYFNFLRRQNIPDVDTGIVKLESNQLVPLRVFAKAHSHKVSVPFDAHLPSVDLTIFPNFATWPTANSKLTATTVHDLTYIYYPEYVEAKNLQHLRRVVPRSLKSADFILTVSESVKAEIVKEFEINADNIVVTQIPPDDMFKKKHTKGELDKVREKYGIGGKYILFLGNFEPRKNLRSLIEAYRALPERLRKEYGLILAGGKGWKSEETQKTLDDAVSAGENIKHIGYVDSDDRPALYQSASLFVFPSAYEGFGIPVLEAMASGCPVVCADIPVLHEAGGDAALYTDASDIKSFAGTLEQALEKFPYTSADMAKNVDRFSWGDNVKKIVDKATTLLDK